jgi:hypothetical protein
MIKRVEEKYRGFFSTSKNSSNTVGNYQKKNFPISAVSFMRKNKFFFFEQIKFI